MIEIEPATAHRHAAPIKVPAACRILAALARIASAHGEPGGGGGGDDDGGAADGAGLAPALRVIGPSFFLGCARRCGDGRDPPAEDHPSAASPAPPAKAGLAAPGAADVGAEAEGGGAGAGADADAAGEAAAANAEAAAEREAEALAPLARDAALAVAVRTGLGRELLRRLPDHPPRGARRNTPALFSSIFSLSLSVCLSLSLSLSLSLLFLSLPPSLPPRSLARSLSPSPSFPPALSLSRSLLSIPHISHSLFVFPPSFSVVLSERMSVSRTRTHSSFIDTS